VWFPGTLRMTTKDPTQSEENLKSYVSTAKTPGAAIAEWYNRRKLSHPARTITRSVPKTKKPSKKLDVLPYPSHDVSDQDALFAPPDDAQAQAIIRRIRIFRKWEQRNG